MHRASLGKPGPPTPKPSCRPATGRQRQPGGGQTIEKAVRLQKFMAAAGTGSRRTAEELIRAGRVTVNGATAQIGNKIVPGRDRVELDAQPVQLNSKTHRAYILNKPRGFVCSRASNEGRTVFALFPDNGPTLLTAGRLDKNSEGLLLLSDKGEWVHRWTHPASGHEKHYRVTVSGPLRGETFLRLNAPMQIDGYETRPAKVRFLRSANRPGRMILEFVLEEGRNRQIRKMCEQVELTVHRLVRTRIGPLTLAHLKPGQWRPLTAQEIQALNRQPCKPEPQGTCVNPAIMV